MSQRSRDLRAEPGRADEPHLKVVRRRSRRLIKRADSRRIATVALGGFVLAVVLVFGILLEQVMLAQSAFKLNQLRDEVGIEEKRHEELLLKAASLDSPRRIERFARETIGMVDPPPERVKYLVARVKVGRDRAVAASSPPEVPASGRGEAALGDGTGSE